MMTTIFGKITRVSRKATGKVGLCALLCLVVSASAKSAFRYSDTGRVFDGTDTGTNASPKPPDYFYSTLERISPDGKYVARLGLGDGEVAYVSVYRTIASRPKFIRRDRVSSEFADVHGCVWVPRHAHWLVVSAGGADYGPGLLALWQDPGKLRWLLHAKAPEGEGYNVRSVSADGRRLVYEHFGDNSPDPNYRRTGHLSMLLPGS